MSLGDLPPWISVTPAQHLAAAQLRFSNDAERARLALADRQMQNEEMWKPQQLEAQRENFLLRNQLGQQALQARQAVAETAAQARRDTALAALQWHTQQTAALKDMYDNRNTAAMAKIDELTRHNQALEGAVAGNTKHKTDVEDQVSSFWKDFTPGTDTTVLMKKYPLVTQDAGIRSFLAQEAIRQRTADNQAEITKRANERNAKTSNPTATVTPTEGPYKGMVLKGDPTSDLLRTNAPGYVPPAPGAAHHAIPNALSALQSAATSGLSGASLPYVSTGGNYGASPATPTPLRFKDKSGKTFRYVGSASDPTSDKDPNSWQQE